VDRRRLVTVEESFRKWQHRVRLYVILTDVIMFPFVRFVHELLLRKRKKTFYVAVAGVKVLRRPPAKQEAFVMCGLLVVLIDSSSMSRITSKNRCSVVPENFSLK